MKILQTIVTILLFAGLFSCAATKRQTTRSLIGKWDNQSGQILDFQKDGKALWVFYTDAKTDTFEIQYSTDFSRTPQEINLTDFQAGPLKGKTLYGIIEFTDENTLRLDFEPTPDNRPKEFDPKQTQTYYRIP